MRVHAGDGAVDARQGVHSAQGVARRCDDVDAEQCDRTTKAGRW